MLFFNILFLIDFFFKIIQKFPHKYHFRGTDLIDFFIPGIELIDQSITCSNGFDHYGWTGGCYKLLQTFYNYNQAVFRCELEGATLAGTAVFGDYRYTSKGSFRKN